MGNLNKVLLIGRLGQNPEKRVTAQGSSVVTLNLATTEKFKDRSGNQQETTEWHRVVFWNQQAEILEQYCSKGSQLYIEGSLQTREWQDKDGNKRWTTEIKGRSFQFLDSANNKTGQGNYQQNQGPAQGQSTQSGFQQGTGPGNPSQGASGFQEPASGPSNQDDFIEDDIPF